jgi:hypothetical protein
MAIGTISNGESGSSVRNKLNQAITRVNEIDKDTNVSVTVGSGGDYASINDALVFMKKIQLAHRETPLTGTITLLSGYQMQEQVIIRGVHLGWITITGQDSITTINRESLTINAASEYGFDVLPAFAAIAGGILPIIDQKFTMNTTGSDVNKTGLACIGANSGADLKDGGGFTNAGQDNVVSNQGAIVTADGCEFSGAGRNNIRALNSGRIDAKNSTFSSGASGDVFCVRASIINIEGSTVNGNVTVSDGGIIVANGITGSPTYSQTVNTIASGGIIFA